MTAFSSSDRDVPVDRTGALLQQLLAIQAPELDRALSQAAEAVHKVFAADKTDTFLLDPATQTLIAVGTSATPMGQQQHAIGLHRLPLVNGGRTAWVFAHDTPYHTGHAEADPEELPGITRDLGIRSTIATPLYIAGEKRGVVLAACAQPDRFTAEDLELLRSIAHWVGLVAHRSELVEHTAQQAAEQARRATAEELLTTLAHDFRNYLTPLKTWLALLERRVTASSSEPPPELSRIATGLDRVNYLIDDLLDVARLEHGLFTLRPASVELSGLVADLCTALRTPYRGIELQTPGELHVSADAQRLQQAMHNLLANALAHSPDDRPVRVTIEAALSDGKGEAVLTVEDQGKGIDPELLPHLFERFHRGAGSSGLGIGLYVAERIASAHDGTLTVDSAPGKGTRCQLRLPIKDAAQPES